MKRILAVAVVTLAVAAAPAFGQNDRPLQRPNSAVEAIAVMEDPERDSWQQPARVVGALSPLAGKSIADIGAGSGYFTLPLAQLAGGAGVVYAIDVEPAFLEEITRKGKSAGLSNIRTVLAPEDDPGLSSSSVDVVFMCNTYPLLNDRPHYLAKIRKILKDKGIFVVISYNEEAAIPDAPPPHKRVSRDKTVSEVTKAGFKLKSEHRFLPHQHFLIFEAASTP